VRWFLLWIVLLASLVLARTALRWGLGAPGEPAVETVVVLAVVPLVELALLRLLAGQHLPWARR
jgi:hypothetical protein